MKTMHLRRTWMYCATLLVLCTYAADFRVPGIRYPAQVREGLTILPGGRVIRPFGRQVFTGTAPFAIAVSPSGRTVVTANIGVSGRKRPSVTMIVPARNDSAWSLSDFFSEPPHPRSSAWQGLTRGLAVTGDNSVWVSEGDTGRVVELNLSAGTRKASVALNDQEHPASFTDEMAFHAGRNLLAVLDQANYRAALIDAKRGVLLGLAKTGVLPTALGISDDGNRLFVANSGSAADPASLSIIDISQPGSPKPITQVLLDDRRTSVTSTGTCPAAGPGPAAPSGIAVDRDRVYVSLAHDDSIAIVNGSTGHKEDEVPLRIPGLEQYRGITPLGLAVDSKSGRLLAAEAGINALAVIDTESRKITGHVPVGWFPTDVAVHDGEVYVANARGSGTGPSSPFQTRQGLAGGPQPLLSYEAEPATLRRGTVSAFRVPAADELARQTEIVMQANGFKPSAPAAEKPLPPINNVVLILKGNRSFDEIFGDIGKLGDSAVLSDPSFARYGSDGYVDGGRKRFSLHAAVTPNQHTLATRWTLADNFYTDSDDSALAWHWFAAAWPGVWSETTPLYIEAGNRGWSAVSASPGRRLFPSGAAVITPEEIPRPGLLADHLEKHGTDSLCYGPAAGSNDQVRVDRFLAVLRNEYLEGRKPLPRFIVLGLPDDQGGAPDPQNGFPYAASYIAGNDYAVGRVVEFLSHTPWWKNMAIFVTETGAEGGADHIDSHRVPLIGIGPWFRNAYVSHTNSSTPALLATICKLLHIAPLGLYDVSAGDLMDMFGVVPDFAPYRAVAEDPRLFPIEKRGN